MILFEDEVILTKTPPLRACWALEGHQACVPITGDRDRRILYGVLGVKQGSLLLHDSSIWDSEEFGVFLRKIKAKWRGWRIMLFLDRASQHKAKASQSLARELGIEIRWLPVACPELNPVDHLWRHLKGEVLANEPEPDLDASLERCHEYLLSLKPSQRLRKAGVLSGDFWLRRVL